MRSINPAIRENLPARRACVNTTVEVGNFKMIMGVGFYDDGRPGEVFVSNTMTGTDFDAMSRDCAVVLSIAMQYGIPLDEIHKSLTKDSSGRPSSVMGELVRQLLSGEVRSMGPAVHQ